MPYHNLPTLPIGRTKYDRTGYDALIKNHADAIANIILTKWIWINELVRYNDLPTQNEYIDRLIKLIVDIIKN